MSNNITETKRVGILNQLLLALHAHKCEKRLIFHPETQCSIPYCGRMREVLTHLRSCENKESCDFKSCKSTRQIIQHWQTCTDYDCCVCKEVRALKNS